MDKKKLILAAPLAVVVLGLVDYIGGEGYSFYEAFLSSLKLLKVNLDILPANNLVLEIARWIGVIFFFSLIYTTIVIKT